MMGILWTAWLAIIVTSFAAFEAFAIITGRMTLSRWTWTVSKYFPPFPFIAGLLVGFLAAHFWWGGIVCFEPVQ